MVSLQITAEALAQPDGIVGSTASGEDPEPAAEVKIYVGNALERVLRFSRVSPSPRLARVLARPNERVRIESAGGRFAIRARRFEPRGALGSLGHPRRWWSAPVIEDVEGPARAAAVALQAPDEESAQARISQALSRSDPRVVSAANALVACPRSRRDPR